MNGDPAASPPEPVVSPGACAKTDRVCFRNVTKAFGRPPDAKVAIQDVSFSIPDKPGVGELITLVGPSGCGKSTILRLLAGLEPHFPATSGEVMALGRPVTAPGIDRGLVDQKYSLLPHLTVSDNIAFGLKLQGLSKRERTAQARDWVGKVGLQGFEHKYPSQLSGGMQQRVAIASTLILKPKILLMDEPFGALDPRTRLSMQSLLIRLWKEQESTVFLVTHSVEEAVYLGDYIFRLSAHPGRLVEIISSPRPDQPPEVVRQSPAFLEMTRHLLQKLEETELGGP
jgi:NitT/TauT family transport system ATP-binding protein